MRTVKTLLLTVLMALTAGNMTAADGDSLRVLWVGNSYTFFSDLPAIVRDIAASQGMKLSMTRVLKGGEYLKGHWANPKLKEHLKAGHWDYIILQEQSTAPAQETERVAREVYPYAHKIDSMAHVYSPQAHTIFYMTWGHKYGAVYASDYPLDDTYEMMQERLITSYLEMTHRNNAWCAPVGWAWRTIRQQHPDYQLYTADCLHPSLLGSYLAANVIFTTIFQKPYQTDVTRDLPAQQAEIIQQTAQQTVLQNLPMLNIRPAGK